MSNIEILSKELISYDIYPIEDLKSYLRVSDDSEVRLIKSQFKAAILYAEQFTGVEIAKKTIKCAFEVSGLNKEFEFFCNVLSVVSMKNSKSELLKKGDDFKIDENKIVFSSKIKGRCEGEFEFGFKDIPELILQGILRHTALLYDRDLIFGDSLESIKILYKGYKRIRI
jgi:hypothetical protein